MNTAMLLFLCATVLFGMGTAKEDNKCGCRVNIVTLSADCSRLRITNVSHVLQCIPFHIQRIYLNSNNISVIPDDAFKSYSSLKYLNLDFNFIDYINDSAFNGLDNLQELSVVANRLSRPDSLSPSVFLPLRNLRMLAIQGNFDVGSRNCSYPEQALTCLPSLESLFIDGIPFVDLGEGFASLNSLTSLTFSGNNYGHCQMPTLTASSFAVLGDTPVSSLTMDGCNVETLLPNVFRKITNLTKLLLTDNRDLRGDAIENATLGLNETNIRHIEFTFWCRNPPFTMRLGDECLAGLTNTSLESLVLENDKIEYISPDVIRHLPLSLKYISIKENKLNDVRFLKNIWRLDNLNTFDGSYQNHYNTLNESSLHTFSPLQNLKLNQTIHINAVDEPVKLPKNIKVLMFNDLKLKYVVPPLSFTANTLEHLNFSNCLLLGFRGPWIGLRSLEFLDLSHNLMSFIHPLSFMDMPNLKALYLQDNHIGPTLKSDENGVTFSKQLRLEILDISSNRFKDIPYLIFKHQFKLHRLSIADNSLQNLNVYLSSLNELKHLNLSGNEIDDISTENRMFLDKLASNSSLELDLTGNTLTCKCEYIDFMSWIANTPVTIHRKDDLTCLFTNNSIVSLNRIGDIITQLKYDCSSWIVLTACIGGFVGLTLVLSLIAIAYHKRWQLRYMYYMGRRNLSPYHPLENSPVDLDIDVYISYESHFCLTQDTDLHMFIADVLYPKLSNAGFNVRIREELSASQFLFNVITDAIRKTRKLLVFITPDYWTDYWNTFEFNMAVYEGIYTKRNMILPVLIGDLSDLRVSNEIRSLMRSKIKCMDYIFIPRAEMLVNGVDGVVEKVAKELN